MFEIGTRVRLTCSCHERAWGTVTKTDRVGKFEPLMYFVRLDISDAHVVEIWCLEQFLEEACRCD